MLCLEMNFAFFTDILLVWQLTFVNPFYFILL